MAARKKHPTAFGSAITHYRCFGIGTWAVPKLCPCEDPTIIVAPYKWKKKKGWRDLQHDSLNFSSSV